jgi:hypothetical protein
MPTKKIVPKEGPTCSAIDLSLTFTPMFLSHTKRRFESVLG